MNQPNTTGDISFVHWSIERWRAEWTYGNLKNKVYIEVYSSIDETHWCTLNAVSLLRIPGVPHNRYAYQVMVTRYRVTEIILRIDMILEWHKKLLCTKQYFAYSENLPGWRRASFIANKLLRVREMWQ